MAGGVPLHRRVAEATRIRAEWRLNAGRVGGSEKAAWSSSPVPGVHRCEVDSLRGVADRGERGAQGAAGVGRVAEGAEDVWEDGVFEAGAGRLAGAEHGDGPVGEVEEAFAGLRLGVFAERDPRL